MKFLNALGYLFGVLSIPAAGVGVWPFIILAILGTGAFIIHGEIKARREWCGWTSSLKPQERGYRK